MKYYTICYPGKHGQHVQETFSEWQILKSYFTYWRQQMQKVGKHEEITIENCIEDWIVCHWAIETDEVGNKITPITKDDFTEFNLEREAERLRDINPTSP